MLLLGGMAAGGLVTAGGWKTYRIHNPARRARPAINEAPAVVANNDRPRVDPPVLDPALPPDPAPVPVANEEPEDIPANGFRLGRELAEAADDDGLAPVRVRGPERARRFPSGEVGLLGQPGEPGSIPLALAIEDLRRLVAARPGVARDRLAGSARFVLVPTATRVRFLDEDRLGPLVRVLDGPSRGREGWAPSETILPEADLAPGLLAEANEALANRQPGQAEWLLARLLAECPDSREAVAASLLMDKAKQAARADPTARLYDKAWRYEQLGKADLALKLYQFLVRDHPGTPEAKHAEESMRRLETLPRR